MGDTSSLNVLSIQRISQAEREQIESVDTRIALTDAGGWFDGEIRQTWSDFAANRYLAADANGQGTQEQRDALLQGAEVILGGWPYPLDLRQRSPLLKWFHQRPAGASNLLRSDLWGSNVVVTTARGYGNTRPIAEYVAGAMLYFAKGLGQAERDRDAGKFAHLSYRPRLIEGRTLCVVGVGGIGRDVGALAAGMGLRVIGTRRTPAVSDAPAGFERVGGPDDLLSMLSESDYVAICAQYTPETKNLIGAQALATMPKGGVIINIARGEVLDEDALVDALNSGQVSGAALDVYVGEFDHPPPQALWEHPNVLVTPHTSAMSDINQHRAIDVFCDNLRAYLSGQTLENVIDWSRGY
jgi:phosphoglycerate dehydrogenase-like enzyme